MRYLILLFWAVNIVYLLVLPGEVPEPTAPSLGNPGTVSIKYDTIEAKGQIQIRYVKTWTVFRTK